MSLERKELPFFNVLPGSTATLTIPPGMNIERFMLQMGGTTFNKTHVSDVRIKANGKVIHTSSGAEIEVRNAYRGYATDPKVLTIDFSELRARDQIGQSIGNVNTLVLSQFTVEVDIAPTAVAPTLQLWSIVTTPAPGRQNDVIAKTLTYPFNIAAAGKWPLALPYGANGGSLIKRVFIKSNNCTGLEIKKNGLVVHESVREVHEFWQRENGKSPQAGYYIYDALVENNHTDLFNTTDALSLEFNATFSGPETVKVIVEYVDRLGNL
ncbi:major capsid protein P2 [Chitiniphilus eburneus]|uniref:major capsid protein P2 n=1 Tax=Chitiniphilus eburneus TaxID=2571148 RepID=UPI0035CF97CD